MSGKKVEYFEVGRGRYWEVRLKNPVQKTGLLVIGLSDEGGFNCPVDHAVHPEDPGRLLIRTRSGLPASGTISVGYSYSDQRASASV
jgi:hypothetical protein